MGKNTIEFKYNQCSGDIKDLQGNLEGWLESKEYNKIIETNEIRALVNKICKKYARNSTLDEDEIVATLLMVVWQNIHKFKVYDGTKSPTARFKNWVKSLLYQVSNYNGKYYRDFVNLDSCGFVNYYQLDDSPFDELKCVEFDFSAWLIIQERLEELQINKRDEGIVKQYYYDNDTQQEIAEELGMSQRGISKILEKFRDLVLKKT